MDEVHKLRTLSVVRRRQNPLGSTCTFSFLGFHLIVKMTVKTVFWNYTPL
jgi:hypothetical protein